MTVDRSKYSRFLQKVAEDIDISPGKYQDAVERYQAVGRWLEDGNYPGCSGELSIYPQGSFRLGTVVRPIRGGVEASYDIDLVSEFPIEKHRTDPGTMKKMVGDRLCEHGTYRRLLDEEGKRCWTLEYAEQDDVGFHLDVLPCISNPSGLLDTSIAITNKKNGTYDWSASNPKGYGLWFDSQNQAAFEFSLSEQKRALQVRAPDIYARVDDVPDLLVRTPLQRSIQLMKRHRDIKFNNARYNGYAPISIIITTLAAQFYQDDSDIYTALSGIVNKLHAHSVLVENGIVDRSKVPYSPIKRTPDGGWYIGNPVNPEENFADRWHEDNHARARAFFSWVAALKEDLLNILDETRPDVLRKRLTAVLGAVATASHLDLIAPVEAAVVSTPKIHISGAAKPWRA
ncbi:hypothetical protein Tel_11145 [Candidatus Tenderia electrophaga]|jgi:hypothetical protein|uniref:Nucleotidyltransferase n=1 Tax=Candidatus Tenderia electrophaga TaxID=1748243 RepID=A0A0S2TER1_9GAMM|nr:hypothetical protein Tel_11145 [Candidatus Tenderia electrophaga]